MTPGVVHFVMASAAALLVLLPPALAEEHPAVPAVRLPRHVLPKPSLPPYPEELEPEKVRDFVEKRGFHCPEGSKLESMQERGGAVTEACRNSAGKLDGPAVRTQKRAGKRRVTSVRLYCDCHDCGHRATWRAEGDAPEFDFYRHPSERKAKELVERYFK